MPPFRNLSRPSNTIPVGNDGSASQALPVRYSMARKEQISIVTDVRVEPEAGALSATVPEVSLVIPAFNEAHRLEATLAEAHAYLNSAFGSSELILVDDGSTDGTFAIAQSFAAAHPCVMALTIPHAGKAAAVRAGMEAGSGPFVAFTDADLATPLTYLAAFVTASQNGADVVIGSREGSGARRIGEPWYRHAMGRVFNALVKVLVLPGIEDTQCGFKLFNRRALDVILPRMLLYRDGTEVAGARVTAFDVELLVIAQAKGLSVLTVPVVWTYGSQSKVNPIRDTLNNARDIALVRLNLWRGRYR